MKTPIFLLVTFLSLFSFGCAQWDTVEPGEVGVLVNYGKLDSHAYRPGFYFYSFLANDMEIMSTRMQTYTFGNKNDQQANHQADPAVEEVINENSQNGPAIQVLSNDQLQVSIDITIQYHLNGTYAPAVFREFSLDYVEAIIEVPVRSAVRMAASEFVARDLVVHRERLQTLMECKVAEQIALTLKAKGIDEHAIIVDNVSLRQIDLPDSLENSIRQVQEQQMQTLQRTQAIETARQEAEQARIQAEGAAQAQLIRANGTAEANRAISASLTPQILRLREFEAQYAMVANPNSRLVVVPYGQPTIINTPPAPAIAAAANHRGNMLKLLYVAVPWMLLAYTAGIFSHKFWLRFMQKKEDKIRIRIERETLEEIPTSRLADELFEREEAWEVISEQADKERKL